MGAKQIIISSVTIVVILFGTLIWLVSGSYNKYYRCGVAKKFYAKYGRQCDLCKGRVHYECLYEKAAFVSTLNYYCNQGPPPESCKSKWSDCSKDLDLATNNLLKSIKKCKKIARDLKKVIKEEDDDDDYGGY